jgi:glyoxylase-like metal-dependent hydrolase (beta-lactamase superfamily II)
MIHEVFPVGMLACNCSILGDEATHEAIIVDPGDDAKQVQRYLDKHGLKAKYIVITHAHIDHVGGIEDLKRATGAAVMMHGNDVPLYKEMEAQAEWLGVEPPAIADIDRLLKEGDRLRWGNLSLEVLHTPGHSPGSISLHVPGDHHRILSGDTLFQGSIGRTDLWGGSMDEILRSIQSRLMIFPDETPVFPGHGLPTMIGVERERNPFLQGI